MIKHSYLYQQVGKHLKNNNKIPSSYVTELCELQFFSSCDARELVEKMFMIDRFRINQQKFNDSLKLWAITTSSLSF